MTIDALTPSAEYETNLVVTVPYSVYLSKNKMGYGRGRHFVLDETSKMQNVISQSIISSMRKQGKKFYPGKVWVSLFIEKPILRVDAMNFVDRISDAIQDAIGVNDYWYSVGSVDWVVKKNNPNITILLSQQFAQPAQLCETCFQEKTIAGNFDRPGLKKIYKQCSSCRV